MRWCRLPLLPIIGFTWLNSQKKGTFSPSIYFSGAIFHSGPFYGRESLNIIQNRCPYDKWSGYGATKIAGGCSAISFLGTTRYLKYNCDTFTGQFCNDMQCSQNCVEATNLDFSGTKQCTRGGQSSNRWYRALYVSPKQIVCRLNSARTLM